MTKRLFLLVFSLFFSFHFFSQEIPPINTFTPEDYGAENQNWAISQSLNKYIYVANNKGLLEFNGAQWQLYPTPNETIMRSVKCIDDVIFSGFYRDFGFWKRNDFGSLQFTSIVKSKNVKMLEDEQIWRILELDGRVIFTSRQRIFLYNLKTESIKIINGENQIFKISKVEDAIYFQDLHKGVFKIENGEPILISNHSILKESKVTEFFKKDNKILVLTQKKGFYYIENNEVQKWKVTSDKVLENKTIYSAIRLKDKSFVLGTISNGVLFLSEDGVVNLKINRLSGLTNNTVLSLFEGIDNTIWLGLDNGINAVNITSPFRVFAHKNIFKGTVYTSIIHNNYIYLGTNQGLYYKNISSKDPFKLILNTKGQVWSLKVVNNTLFCGHNSGTFVVKNHLAKLISDIEGTWGVKKINENTLLQGNYDGLYVLAKENNRWKLRNKLKGFSNSCRYFILTNNNTILVNHEYKGVFKLKVDKEYREIIKVVLDESVEKGLHSSLIKYNNDILYSSKNGVYKYQFKKETFKRDTLLSKLIPKNKFLSAKLIFDNATNKLWAFTEEDIRFYAPDNLSDKITLERIPIKGSLHKGVTGFENVIHLKDKKYLVGTSKGYIELNLNNIVEPEDFEIAINKIYNSQIDKPKKEISLSKNSVEFKSFENNFEFFFSAPNFNKTSFVKYQYLLKGAKEKWSNLSGKNSILFENLSFGNYTFKVRALIDNKLSKNVAEYSFVISKPWYLSNLMVAIYVLLFLFLLYSFHSVTKRYYRKQRVRLLEKAQRELELKELESSQKIIKLNNEKLKNDIESKNRELATSTMSIIKKNEFLNRIKKELVEGNGKNVDRVVKIIDKTLNNTDDWKMFQEAFNNADKKFLKKVKSRHPDLTPNDLRLCAYLRLNLSSKEIAPLLNISPRSVEVKRYRLRKKMNLDHNDNLTNYILEI